jgi:hypothetical protein
MSKAASAQSPVHHEAVHADIGEQLLAADKSPVDRMPDRSYRKRHRDGHQSYGQKESRFPR